MFLNFWYILDVNKNKFCCNILFYLIVKTLIVTPDAIWYNPHLQSYSNLLSRGSLSGMVLLLKWSVILSFYCLIFCCVILVCCVCMLVIICFYCYFCNWIFRKTLWRKPSFVMSIYFSLSPRNTLLCSVLKQREKYVKTSFQRCSDMKYMWSVGTDHAGDCFSSHAFWKLCQFFYAINWFINLINNLFSSRQYIQCVFNFFLTLLFNLIYF